jgi:hypothetical protein
MRTTGGLISATLFLLVLVGCKGEEPARPSATEDRADKAARPVEPPPPPPPPPPEAPAEPAAPEPKTPAEIDLALKTAMVEGRDLDVIKYCEMDAIANSKNNTQTFLGCTLAACRAHQAEKARSWSVGLPKALKKQAIQVCMANDVIL